MIFNLLYTEPKSSPPRTKSLIVWNTLLISTAGLFVACVHHEQDLTLRSDGSGEFAVSYLFPNSTLELMKTYFATDVPSISHDILFDDDTIREEFSNYESLGVRVKDVRITEEEFGKRSRLVLTFESLNGLVNTHFFRECNVSLRRNAQGRYVFTLTSARAPRRSRHTEDPINLTGLHVELRYSVPGRISESNADRQEESTAIWTFDLHKDSNALRRLERAHLRIEFEASLPLEEFGQVLVRLSGPQLLTPDESLPTGEYLD